MKNKLPWNRVVMVTRKPYGTLKEKPGGLYYEVPASHAEDFRMLCEMAKDIWAHDYAVESDKLNTRDYARKLWKEIFEPCALANEEASYEKQKGGKG